MRLGLIYLSISVSLLRPMVDTSFDAAPTTEKNCSEPLYQTNMTTSHTVMRFSQTQATKRHNQVTCCSGASKAGHWLALQGLPYRQTAGTAPLDGLELQLYL